MKRTRPFTAACIYALACSVVQAQCEGWIHDEYTYGETYWSLSERPPVVWDPDGRDGPLLAELAVVGMATCYNCPRFLEIFSLRAGSTRLHPLEPGFSNSEQSEALRPIRRPDGTNALCRVDYKYGTDQTIVSERVGASWVPIGPAIPDRVESVAGWWPDGPSGERRVLVAQMPGTTDSFDFRILLLSGGSWNQAGSLRGLVRGIVAWDPDHDGPLQQQVIAYGSLALDGGATFTDGVAAWNGSSWVPVGDGIPGLVNSVVEFQHQLVTGGHRFLVAGGSFRAADGAPGDYLVMWDGETWQPFTESPNGPVTAVAVRPSPASVGDALVIAGDFESVGPMPAQSSAMLDGEMWHDLSGEFVNPPKHLVWWDENGPVRGGGQLLAWSVNDVDYSGVTRRLGDADWEPLIDETPRPIGALTTWDQNGMGPHSAVAVLRAIGRVVDMSDGSDVYSIVTWNGAEFATLGIPSEVAEGTRVACPWDADGNPTTPAWLVLAGEFAVPDYSGALMRNIGAWDGTRMRALRDGLSDPANPNEPTVDSVAEWDPDGSGPLRPHLLAGGTFVQSGSRSVRMIASFDLIEWNTLGSGVEGGTGWEPGVKQVRLWDPDGAGPQPVVPWIGGNIRLDGIAKHWLYWKDGAWVDPPFASMPPNLHLTSMERWDPDGPGLLPESPVVCCSWTEIWGGKTAWWWNGWEWVVALFNGMPLDHDEFGGPSINEMTTWDPDGSGPRPNDLAIAGRFNTITVSETLFRSVASGPGITRGVYAGNVWANLYSNWYSEAGTVLSYDPDGESGPINPVLMVGGSFENLTDTMLGRIYGVSWFARYLAGSPTAVRIPHPRPNSGSRAVALAVRAVGPGIISYAWRRNGIPLTPGRTAWGSVVHGVDGETLTISRPRSDDVAVYDCVLTNACGSTVSAGLLLDPPCPSDINDDGLVDILDLLGFLDALSACESIQGQCDYLGVDPDMNLDRIHDIIDFLDFMDAFADPCR